MPVIIVLEGFYRFGVGWAEFGFHSSYAMLFGGIAIVLARTRRTIFVNPYIIWIGKISFSGYLWHLALIHAVPANFPKLSPMANLIWFYLALAALTVAAASVTYLVVEKPFIALGNRFLNSIAGEATEERVAAV
jgi:peptidoglycan/LPS O-acetylase OafA/YrhL